MNLSIVFHALLATLFTWFVTLLGAGTVIFFKNINKIIMDSMLALASGIMISASFFSLLIPAIEMTENLSMNKVLIPSIGFLSGGLLIILMNYLLSKKQKNITNKKKRCMLLITSITLHNIPEGLAIGVAFGSIVYHLNGITLSNAIGLAIGIALQNFPEGMIVSVPLIREGINKKKAFFYGQLSGFVEPIAGIIGALLVLKIRIILPFFLALAAGAMIYVVTEELIPESQTNPQKEIMTFSTLLGFIIMMILDVLL